jgi:hypothetical protein
VDQPRCMHGLDVRFCAICNTRSAGSRPRAAIADTTLDEILRFLNDEQVRATYGAVAEVLGVAPISMGTRLGERSPEASWIVNAADGLPTGYAQHDMHPALFDRNDIISAGMQLAMRMTAWKAKKKG